MPRSPRLTSDTVLRALLRAGWSETRLAGSHVILHSPDTPVRRVTVPLHRGRILKPKTRASIVGQSGFTMEEFERLL